MKFEEFMSDVFGDPRKKQKSDNGDPFETEEYQRFVESMCEHCHCIESNRPCDGVLAGGLCDGFKGNEFNAAQFDADLAESDE